MREITPPRAISTMKPTVPPHEHMRNRLRIYRSGHKNEQVTIPLILADELLRFLDEQDKRVSDLINANSREVIRYRVVNAKLKRLLEMAQKAAATFRRYGVLHRAKQTEDGDRKALVNDQIADELEQAMLWEPNPDDYGKIRDAGT